MNRATCWSVTLNNPTKDDDECIAKAKQKGWKVEGQLEKGENGTPHYQLMVRTPQVRFSAVKKQFPRGHIEIARSPAALKQYVQKEETKVADLNIQSEKYPSLSKMWDLVYDEISEQIGHPAEDHYWSEMSDRSKLDLFDDAISKLIYKGYHVETIAVNPQTRACFTKFARVILIRSWGDRQTDRQCVQIPVTNMEDENKDAIEDDNDGEEEDSETSSQRECSEGDEDSEASEDEGFDEGSYDSVSETSSQSEE